MTDDLAGIGEEVTGNGHANGGGGSEYDGWDETVPEARVSGQVVPSHQFYVAQPFTAKLGQLKEGKTPAGRVGIKLVQGVEGGVGERIFDDIYLGVNPEKEDEDLGFLPNGRPVKRPKTAEELARATAFFQNTLNRIAYVLDLPMKRPANKSKAAYEAYLSQFNREDLPLFVVEVTIDAKQSPPRNRIQWLSARKVTDAAVDRKLAAAGKTALDEATQRIAERNKAQGTGKSATAPTIAKAITID